MIYAASETPTPKYSDLLSPTVLPRSFPPVRHCCGCLALFLDWCCFLEFFNDAGEDPLKPMLFELVAQEQLRDLLQPALKYVL